MRMFQQEDKSVVEKERRPTVSWDLVASFTNLMNN
jgi:hypothetical protein